MIPGSKLGTVQNVGVSGCAEDAKECVLKRNTNATISIDFTPSKSTNLSIKGILLNHSIYFDPLWASRETVEFNLIRPGDLDESTSLLGSYMGSRWPYSHCTCLFECVNLK